MMQYAMMQYKGYSAYVVLDEENGIFHGEVLGIRDVVTFQGTSVEELQRAFHDSVEDYLDFCRERGETADKPLSGRFVVRMSSELHRGIAAVAKESGQSLNAWVVSQLVKGVPEAVDAVIYSAVRSGTQRRPSRGARRAIKKAPKRRQTTNG
jgi:predicted HicB family RNase H-like nuclease